MAIGDHIYWKINHFKRFRYNSPVEPIGGAYGPNAQDNCAVEKTIAMHKSRLSWISASIYRMLTLMMISLCGSYFGAIRAAADPLHTIEVAEGVFAYQAVHGLMDGTNRGHIANLGFVVGDAAVAVIDTGGSRIEGAELLAAIRRTTDRPVRYVIATHMHPDHVFGNAAFADMGPDVAFVGHARLNAALASRFDHYLSANRATMGADLLEGVTRVPATIEVADRLSLDLGGRSLELRAWPTAHTDNDLTVFDEKTATLFAGDLVFLEHLPSIDGSLRGWQAVMEELAAIPAARVVPGHGPVAAPWPAALEPQRRYFATLAADIRAALDAGRPLSDAVRTAGRSEAANWQLFDEFNARNATTAYAELEWE